MLTDQLLTELNNLNKAEKLRVVQLLVNELATDADEASYEVWSPYESEATAGALMILLKDDPRSKNR